MPELPEVEHIVRALERAVTGAQVVAAELRQKKLAPGLSRASFNRKLAGARINAVRRRGKFILFELDTAQVLLVHLRMTGKFLALNPDDSLPAYAHVIFYLADERRLVFCDMRQFGRMKILPAPLVQASRELASLAPEPLSDDFTPDYLYATLSRSQRPLKLLLLDQTRVLGLGNIYASEALWIARISPFAVTASVAKRRVVRLHAAIQEVLNEAISQGSTLQIDLADGGARYFGSPERFWRVYEREGEPCGNCGTKIRRAVQGGRSTYYCPRCQRR